MSPELLWNPFGVRGLLFIQPRAARFALTLGSVLQRLRRSHSVRERLRESLMRGQSDLWRGNLLGLSRQESLCLRMRGFGQLFTHGVRTPKALQNTAQGQREARRPGLV